jgi:plastocyanin
MRCTVLAVVLAMAASSHAAEPVKKSAREEIARLEKELDEQRALLVHLLEVQASCTEQLLRLAKGQPSQAVVATVTPAATVSAPLVAPVVEPAPAPVLTPAPKSPKATKSTAEVTGRVHVSNGGPAWVFVEDVHGAASEGALEIRQQDKQFSPRVAAVPRGTKVTFPNYDVVYHNVFSLTPGQAFDLGMVRAGDAVKSRAFVKPGVVEIFCNLHSKMSASVLVTPGPLLARVGADGTFRLEGVPLGVHKVSAWAGGHEVDTRSVEVGPGGASVDFDVKGGGDRPHTNKLGQPYGSYDE